MRCGEKYYSRTVYFLMISASSLSNHESKGTYQSEHCLNVKNQ